MAKRRRSVKVQFDVVDFVMRLECGDPTLIETEVVAGFQHLIDTGMAYTLQGSYGRAAEALIAAGHCTARKEG